jgi:hypothetical protein
MLPWIISHDLMRANEEEAVRATRYAHHRAHTYRRPGPFLAALLQAGLSRVPVPRRVSSELADLTPMAGDTLGLTVSDLGRIDTVEPPTDRVPGLAPTRGTRLLATRRLDRKEQA